MLNWMLDNDKHILIYNTGIDLKFFMLVDEFKNGFGEI